jgi:hypothetical protein
MRDAPEPPRDPVTPYWRRHYGIAQPWRATDRGRGGCIWMLVLVLAVMIVVGIVAALVVLLD